MNGIQGEANIVFLCSLSDFFLDFRREITEKGLKWPKEFENGSKNVFQQHQQKTLFTKGSKNRNPTLWKPGSFENQTF